MAALDFNALIKKYDVPTPRYTSYPTVPHWDTANFQVRDWKASVKQCFDESNDTRGISLYIHLPYCESLCTYCACNTRITRNHNVENTYIASLLAEWEQYKLIFGRTPVIRELHLGGGTPTFFSPANLRNLISNLLKDCVIHQDHEFGFEGHPNNTIEDHLRTLYELGFRRVSFGVQDLDEKVQKTINRVQPFDHVREVTEASRAIGYTSVSFDLVYGLPFQTTATVSNTIRKVLTLRPDRISFYSYAHVPWIKPGQRGYEDSDLPSDVQKRLLYETGRALLKENGYEDVGMDHFALPHDDLFKARLQGTLHRNFMGYTTSQTELLIGLGTSAISDSKYAYAQNLKTVEAYRDKIDTGNLAVFKGHLLTERDLFTRRTILDISCAGYIRGESLAKFDNGHTLETVNEMVEEGILTPTIDGYEVTEKGRAFIRNICSAFDEHLVPEQGGVVKQVFSQSI